MSSTRSLDPSASQPSLKRGRERQKPSKSQLSNPEDSTAQTVINQYISGMGVKEEPVAQEVPTGAKEDLAKARLYIMKQNISP
ncbi:hypothetical protein MSAN_00776800 [Mycena sanguinolenta]|uniref:Uncharacterized protein n=1 Tax=Mycena sanguinolenta TaxID=230812 RepID=A0A8H6Z5V0_9AGAR|nr:hypothetical protein MSAN_00776800 [Mycena sanguinolenta]